MTTSHSSKHFSSTSLSSGESTDSCTPGPLKAKTKMSVRKVSTDNLLDGDDKKPAGPVRASSLEDLHALTKKQSSGGKSPSGGAMSGKIVDAVVKVYQPDHTHKYIDISPVRRGGEGGREGGRGMREGGREGRKRRGEGGDRREGVDGQSGHACKDTS